MKKLRINNMFYLIGLAFRLAWQDPRLNRYSYWSEIQKHKHSNITVNIK